MEDEIVLKILQLNCVYGTGSTGKIVETLYEYQKQQGDDPYVIYGMGPKQKDAHLKRATPWLVRKIQSIRSRITGYPYGGCIWGTIHTLRIIKRIQPDVVHLQCANCYMVNIYRILEYLKKNNIPTLITNHAEFMYTGGCTHTVDCDKWKTGCHHCEKINKEHPISYFFDRTEKEWKLLKKAYAGFNRLIVCCVSDWVKERAQQSPFYAGYPVVTVLNGLNTDIFKYSESSSIKRRMGLDGKKIIIHITPDFYSRIKGGFHVIEMAKRLPDIEFVIVGSEAKSEAMPSNCHFVGTITDQKVIAQYYSMADICLITSIRETFSMVCAESLCCGTPVVGFKAGGPECIALTEYSVFVEQGNDDKLERAIRMVLDKQYSKQEITKIAIEKYGQKCMCKNYYEIYNTIIK